jgi:hypothetical protein
MMEPARITAVDVLWDASHVARESDPKPQSTAIGNGLDSCVPRAMASLDSEDRSKDKTPFPRTAS